MKRLTLLVLAASLGAGVLPSLVRAEEGPEPLVFREDVGNLASVQRGARDFMSYCSGCHSMKYLRYSRLGADAGIPEDLLKANLMFTSDKVGDTIKSAMPAQAKDWFGQQPPDLSLETKARGSDWVYSYLQAFYLDPTRPLGVNNTYLPGVSMPHVLGELQGWQKKVEPEDKKKREDVAAASGGSNGSNGGGGTGHGDGAGGGESGSHETHFELVQPGTMSPEEYKVFVTDLTNFMAYAAEPGKSDRIATGFKVMLYLFVLTALTYFLKKEFWRDVH